MGLQEKEEQLQFDLKKQFNQQMEERDEYIQDMTRRQSQMALEENKEFFMVMKEQMQQQLHEKESHIIQLKDQLHLLQRRPEEQPQEQFLQALEQKELELEDLRKRYEMSRVQF